MTSLIINLLFAVFYLQSLQSLSCEVIDKSKGDLNSSNNNYFPSCPPDQFQLRYCFSKFPPWFSASINLPFAISTTDRSSLASHSVCTKMVPEKVHALPFNRKPLSFPWLRKNLLVFLGSVFSWVSSMYILCHGIPSWIFSHSNESAHSNEAAPIHFLHCCWLTYFACT